MIRSISKIKKCGNGFHNKNRMRLISVKSNLSRREILFSFSSATSVNNIAKQVNSNSDNVNSNSDNTDTTNNTTTKDVIILDERDAFIFNQAMATSQMISNYINFLEIDLTVTQDKYIYNSLIAYDELVTKLSDVRVKQLLRASLANVVPNFQSCLRNPCV
jgi:hypothetical protein